MINLLAMYILYPCLCYWLTYYLRIVFTGKQSIDEEHVLFDNAKSKYMWYSVSTGWVLSDLYMLTNICNHDVFVNLIKSTFRTILSQYLGFPLV